MKSTKAEGHEKEISIPFTEKLKTIPEIFGIRVNEEPSYQVLKKDGDFEVQRYQGQILAEVTMTGVEFDQFREAGRMGESAGAEVVQTSDGIFFKSEKNERALKESSEKLQGFHFSKLEDLEKLDSEQISADVKRLTSMSADLSP